MATEDNYEPTGILGLTPQQENTVLNYFKPLGWEAIPKCKSCNDIATTTFTQDAYGMSGSDHRPIGGRFTYYFCDKCAGAHLLRESLARSDDDLINEMKEKERFKQITCQSEKENGQ